MATWPLALPAALVGSPLNIQPGVRRAEFLSGHVRQRMVMASPFDTYAATFTFSNPEFRVFEYFIRETINSVDWFTGPYHDGAGHSASGTIRIVGGAYSAEKSADTDQWTVTTTIEIDGRK